MEFDSIGIRSDVEIDVMTLDAGGLKKTGSFKPTREKYPFMLVENQQEEFIDTSNLPIDQMTFTVITSLVKMANKIFRKKRPIFFRRMAILSSQKFFQYIQEERFFRSIHMQC